MDFSIIDNLLAQLRAIHPVMVPTIGLTGLLIVAWLVGVFARRRLQSLARLLARQTSAKWDDILVEQGVFSRLAHLIPAAIVYFGVNLIPDLHDDVLLVLRNVAVAFGVLSIVRAISATLTAANVIYESGGHAVERPIKGYIQVTKLGLYCFGAILVVSALIDKSPIILLSGFGAMTAVLLLVFKDTILSLVASIQLSSLDMIRVGDWIEMPKFNADGDVIDVALHTVRVQNWDKTITTIPTHRLISDSFMNWRGMQQSGGRRIKRALSIDMRSVRFLTDDEIAHFKRFVLLKGYLSEKQDELDAYNDGLAEKTDAGVNLRRLTNLGTLRAYIVSYLRNHPQTHKEMTMMVRQLQPGATGVPIEIYCFTDTVKWLEYEGIQSDLFDHLLAILPEFGLEVFQSPSGGDIATLQSAASGISDQSRRPSDEIDQPQDSPQIEKDANDA
ncbi:MAG: mechanosensitive ion channel family protein [Woeseiaceae bacterium]